MDHSCSQPINHAHPHLIRLDTGSVWHSLWPHAVYSTHLPTGKPHHIQVKHRLQSAPYLLLGKDLGKGEKVQSGIGLMKPCAKFIILELPFIQLRSCKWNQIKLNFLLLPLIQVWIASQYPVSSQYPQFRFIWNSRVIHNSVPNFAQPCLNTHAEIKSFTTWFFRIQWLSFPSHVFTVYLFVCIFLHICKG